MIGKKMPLFLVKQGLMEVLTKGEVKTFTFREEKREAACATYNVR